MTETISKTKVACGCSGNPKFDGVDPAYKRVLWGVIFINAAMFFVEMSAGKLAGSQALQADALDFLGDALTYGLSLAVIGMSLKVRSTAALIKGLSLLFMGLLGLWLDGLPDIHFGRSKRADHGFNRAAGAGRKLGKCPAFDALQGR